MTLLVRTLGIILIWSGFCIAQTIIAQTITVVQTDPAIPANLKPMASAGDMTRCVATLQKTARNIHLDCKIGTVVTMTITAIWQTSVVGNGDLMWIFNYDAVNLKVVHFSVAANIRNTAKAVTGNSVVSVGDIVWP